MKLDPKLKGYDIFCVIAYIVIFIIISAVGRVDDVLLFLGIPLFFVLPGYLTMLAMFPRSGTISLSERIALTLGLSVIILPSMGLILNFTPFGIRLFPILIMLLIVSIAIAAAVLFQRRTIDQKEQFPPPINIGKSDLTPNDTGASDNTTRPNVLTVSIIVLIIIVMIGVFYMVFLIATTPQPTEEFTEMSVLTASGGMVEKPFLANMNDTAGFKLTVRNHEGEAVSYQLRIRSIPFTSQWELNETAPAGISDLSYPGDLTGSIKLVNGTTVIHNFTLADRKELKQLLDLNFQARGNYQLRFELYADDTTPNAEPKLEVYFIVMVL